MQEPIEIINVIVDDPDGTIHDVITIHVYEDSYEVFTYWDLHADDYKEQW